MMISLAQLANGEQGKICGYWPGNKEYRQKLLAMGLTPNTLFRVIRRAPLGDPIEINVRNTLLILRQPEAVLLKIERVTT